MHTVELKCTVPVGHPSDSFFNNPKKVRCVVIVDGNNWLHTKICVIFAGITFYVMDLVKLSTTGAMQL